MAGMCSPAGGRIGQVDKRSITIQNVFCKFNNKLLLRLVVEHTCPPGGYGKKHIATKSVCPGSRGY